MNWKDRIEVNPAVLVGKPIIKGTRISVELILDRMADGWTMEDVLTAYTNISREDVLAASSFASELLKKEALIRSSLEKDIQQDPVVDARAFFKRLKPLESFANVEPETYVRKLRNTSRLLKSS